MSRAAATALLHLLLLIAGTSGVAAEPCPQVEGNLGTLGLPEVLDVPEVRRSLDSGLTTTFLVRVQQRGGEPLGGARLEIRFEPWDEVYEVVLQGIDGEVRRRVLPSFDDLGTWWQGLRLPVVQWKLLSSLRASKLRIGLDVLPFSADEERDAERWLGGKLRRPASGRRNAADVGQGRDEVPETLSQTFNVLIATSIRRNPMESFQWTCDLPSEPAAGETP